MGPGKRGKGWFCVSGTAFFLFLGLVGALVSHRLLLVGSGDSQFLMLALGLEYQKVHPDVVVVVPPSVHTGGGIKAVLEGKAHLARISRPLLPHERVEGLRYCFFARTPVVFVVHPSVKGVDGLTREQVLGIYQGKIKNWKELGGPDHKIYVVQREPGDSCRTVLERYFPQLSRVPEGVAYTAFSTPEALMVIEAHNYTIGYLPLAAARAGNVKPLALDGVAPTLENLEKGKYKYWVPLGVAYKEPLSPRIAEFLKFLGTPRAREVMRNFGSLPTGGCDK